MQIEFSNNTIFLYGEFDYKITSSQLKKLSALLAQKNTSLDLKGLKSLDYAGAYFLKEHFKGSNIVGASGNISRILDFVDFKSYELPKSVEFSPVERLGMLLLNAKAQGIAIISFIGQVLIMILDSLMRPWRIRLKELSNHIISAGISAIFIVGLTAFLIGIVLAYQGAVMLERFGASVLVVDIMGIITLREIAPLIASIVVAGRSASNFTAQIGVMKITEELYAMETMGFAPFRFVVMPRILALIFVMPVVILCADFISLFGQAFVCNWYLGLDFESYLNRFSANVDMRHFWVGLVKAPIFGALIATIGCLRGYEVNGSTESVGKLTTKSVVNAIFWIIALDAVFSVIFTELQI